jgi:hypothetical protein
MNGDEIIISGTRGKIILPISHQTGDLSTTFPFHKTESMKDVKLDNETHKIYKQVAGFRACKCRGNRIETRTKLMKEKALNTRLEVVMMAQEVNKTAFFDLLRP